MNRRSFFGFGAGAVVAGPSAMAAATKTTPKVASLGITIDKTPALEAMLGEARAIAGVAGRIRPLQFGGPQDRHYVYRTGYPAIDALRSVSGVHKALMEKRMES